MLNPVVINDKRAHINRGQRAKRKSEEVLRPRFAYILQVRLSRNARLLLVRFEDYFKVCDYNTAL